MLPTISGALIRPPRRAVLLTLLTLAASACGGGDQTGPGEIAFIGLNGAPESGELFVGQYLSLQAATYDGDNHLVTGVPLTWSSSNEQVAAVEPWSDGVSVYGVAPGRVRITASADGESAAVELTVVIVPIASVRVTPGASAAYVGASAQLSVTVTDSLGSTPSAPEVSWTSSDQSRVTVDATGRVTAVGTGTATITATVDGTSGSATVTVLPRPTADWSGVTEEWSTFQGNADHTGYVPATLDPARFADSWEVPLGPDALNPVALGDGKVFASTNSYFGAQRLQALEAVTGGVLWTYEFGQIHSVDPPAYADGRVYVTTGGHEDSFVWGFDAASGTIGIRTSYDNQWGRWYAPVIQGQTLFMAGGYYGGMYGINTADGSVRWFRELNQYDLFTPAVRGGRVYAYTGDYDPKVTVADAATGEVLYEIADPRFNWSGWSMDAAPVLGAQGNLLATQGGRLLSFNLDARTIGWELTGGFGGQPVVANGLVYAFKSGAVEARQESDGALRWIWVMPDDLPSGTMIVTRNLLFVSGAATTYAVDLAAGLQVWSRPGGGHLALSKDGLLLIAQTNGRLAALTVK